MQRNPERELRAGAEVLGRVLSARGFEFHMSSSGRSCGGLFANGCFASGQWALKFSVRYTLGLVEYAHGEKCISHSDFMRAVRADSQYPGFGSSIQSAFERLALDIEAFATAFLNREEQAFEEIVGWVAKNPAPSGFAAFRDQSDA